MSISVKGKSVHFDGRHLHVELEDDCVILTPIYGGQSYRQLITNLSVKEPA